MSNIVEAEYQVISESSRSLPVIVAEIKTMETTVYRVTLQGIIRIGECLEEAKQQVGHGGWYDWCKDNLGYTQKQAQRFMQIARTYGDENSPYSNVTNLADLSISKALALLQVPEEQVENFVETHDVESMKFKELEEEIKALKESNEEAAAIKEEAAKMKMELDQLKAAGADPEKIVDLESKLEKQKDKNKKLAKDLKAEKESKEKAIAEALDEKEAELKAQAEDAVGERLLQMGKEKLELEEKIESLNRRIENSSDENKLAFKLRVDQLQGVYAACEMCIEVERDQETKQKMRSALETVMNSLRGGI